jgi:hypothetical protein
VAVSDIGDFFVREILKVPPSGPGATQDIVILMARANTYTIMKTPEEEIGNVLSKLPADDATTIRVNYDRLMNRQLTLMQTQYQQQLTLGESEPTSASSPPIHTAPAYATTTNAATTNMETTAPHPVTPAAVGRQAAIHSPPEIATRHQKVDLVERKDLKNMRTALEKIEALVRLEEERGMGSMTAGAKTFASKFLKPAIKCLQNHCGGDCAAFAAKYPQFNHTTFPTLSCCGEGAECAPKQLE